MDIKQSSEKQGRPYHLSDSGTVIKRNFILIPAYILLQSIVPIIVVFGSLGITAMITQQAPPQWLYHCSLSLSFVIAQGLILIIFYKMHQSVINDVMKQQWIIAKNKIIKIVIVAIVVYLLLIIVRVIGTSLPNHLSYHLTQYEQRTLVLFKSPYVLLVTFISMVFLRPMVEQIIYRYLIIHELGKVWNRQFVIGLSIVIETIVHVYDMASIFEIFPYIVIASAATILYIKSRDNLIVAYIFQVILQCILFIEILCKYTNF